MRPIVFVEVFSECIDLFTEDEVVELQRFVAEARDIRVVMTLKALVTTHRLGVEKAIAGLKETVCI